MRLFLITLLLSLVPVAAAFSQDDPIGVTDTVALVTTVCPSPGGSDQLVLELWVFNDEVLSEASCGFSWDNPKLQMDSAVASDLAWEGFDLYQMFYEDDQIEVTNANLHFGLAAMCVFGAGLPAGNERRLWATYYFTATGWIQADSVTFDTLTYDAGAELILTTLAGDTEISPAWAGSVACGTACPVPEFTMSPAPIDTLFCESGSVCVPLVCENADEIVSSLGAAIGAGEICWSFAGTTNVIDTIVATSSCGADTCFVPLAVTIDRPPAFGMIEDTITIPADTLSPCCVELPIQRALQVSVQSTPMGLTATWSADQLCLAFYGPAAYQVVVTAENDCGESVCSLSVQIVPTGITPTNEWVSFWCETPLVDGAPMNPGDTIKVTDPDGVLCGMTTANGLGGYGYLNVYRDDPYTAWDEGAEPGDVLTFWINDVEAIMSPPVIWTANGDIFAECDFITEYCQTLALRTGWNLVSWNIGYTAAVEEMLSGLNGCVDVVLSLYDQGVVYDPDLPEFSTLDTMDYRHGYWFRMYCPATIELCGPPIDSSEVLPVRSGWNLLSYHPDQALPVEQAIASIGGCARVVLGFDGGGQVWVPGMDLYNTLTDMQPGFGYWLKSACDTVLIYPGFGSAGMPVAKSHAPTQPALSPYWMSVYAADLVIDDEPVRAGASVEFRTVAGTTCGSGIYDGRRLKLTPVYGSAGINSDGNGLPGPGDRVSVWIDGRPTGSTIVWTGHGDRVDLANVSSGAPINLPSAFRLYQNYPNPFNPGTEIRFDLPAASHVVLEVFNLLGRRVRSLVDTRLESGSYGFEWDGTDDAGRPVASGPYFYRVMAGETTDTKKMLLLK